MLAGQVIARFVPARSAATLAVVLAVVPCLGSAGTPTTRIAVPGGVLVVTQAKAATMVAMLKHGVKPGGRLAQAWRVRLPPDDGPIISAGTFQAAAAVGIVGPAVVVLTTTYASQTGVGGPQARCAAGQEIILRVIRLAPVPRQTFSLPLESCWTDVYRMPVAWDAPASSIRVGDGAGGTDEEVPPYRVHPDGTVTAGAIPH